MLTITSLSNERIKSYKALKTKKGREEAHAYLLEGKRAVLDALNHKVLFEAVLLEENSELMRLFNQNPSLFPCEVIAVPRKIIEALSETASPEGIIAVAKMRNTQFSAKGLDGVTVFLDCLQDAGNLGTVIRTADACGVSAVILSPGCVELFNPKTVRATMASMFNVRVMRAEDTGLALDSLKAEGYTIYAAALNGESFYNTEISGSKNCIIIGNEGNGISEPALKKADKIISLPMKGGAESLNASVAAGVLLYGFTFGK